MSILSIKYESFFLEMVYSGKPIHDILDEVTAIIGYPIRFSPNNRIEDAICSSGYPKEDIQDIHKLLNNESPFNVFLSVSMQDSPEKPAIYECENEQTGEITRIFCNVIIGNRYFGNVTIPVMDGNAHSLDLDFVLMVSRIIGLSCAISGKYGYEISKENMLMRLLMGDIRSYEEMYIEPESLDFFTGTSWRLLCSNVPKDKKMVILQTAFQRAFPKELTVYYNKNVIMLFSGAFSPQDAEKCEKIAQTYECTVACSPMFDDILDCREIMLCLAHLPEMTSDYVGYVDCRRHIDNILFYASKLRKEKAAQYLCEDLLKIREYDEKNNTEYIKTIQMYLESSYQTKTVAEKLHTHKNTIAYRLSRIHDLFGLDLHDNQTLYRLNLGINALHYWNI